MKNFLNIIIGCNRDVDVADRVITTFPHIIPGSWIHSICLEDDDTEEDDNDKPITYSVSFSVRFPQTDYDWVCDELRKYLHSVDIHNMKYSK